MPTLRIPPDLDMYYTVDDYTDPWLEPETVLMLHGNAESSASWYAWPGNVRELVNTLDRALAATRHEPTLYANHLPSYIRVQAVRQTVSRDGSETEPPSLHSPSATLFPKLRDYREAAIAEAERQYLQELMTLTENDLKEACTISDLSQPRLYASSRNTALAGPNDLYCLTIIFIALKQLDYCQAIICLPFLGSPPTFLP